MTDESAINRSIGRVGKIEWLRADTIKPWRLQRALSIINARKIAHGFDPDMIGYLVVSRRDGVPYLLDGQHRHYAIVEMMKWGDQNVPCLVYDDLTDEHEDKIFHMQGPGVRHQLSSLHDFHVLIDMGDTVAVHINHTVTAAGLRIPTNTSSAHNTVRCVTALRSVANTHGYFALGTILILLRDSLGPESQAYGADMVHGTAIFLDRYGDAYDRVRLVERMRAIGFSAIMRDAFALTAAIKCGKTRGIARTLVNIYNTRLRSGRLVEWEQSEPDRTRRNIEGAQAGYEKRRNMMSVALGAPNRSALEA